MELDFSNVEINNPDDLLEFARKYNEKIRMMNRGKSKAEQLPELKIGYLLQRYHQVRRKTEIDEFRKKYECRQCIEFKMHRCRAIDRCWYATVPEVKLEPKRCSRDKIGNCPYGDTNGSCVGVCIRDIIEDFERKKTSKRKGEMNE